MIIGKTRADAEKEFDRTAEYILNTISALRDLENKESTFVHDGGYFAQVRRAPLGVTLCCGPFNYPFNETYTLVIPALIMYAFGSPSSNLFQGQHGGNETTSDWCSLSLPNIGNLSENLPTRF